MPITETNEKRFEADIESFFLSAAGGYTEGTAAYDAALGLFPASLVAFVQRTQPKEWAKFEMRNAVNPAHKFCQAFANACEMQGLLQVLRKGFKHRGLSFQVCYFKPESALNRLSTELYEANETACYRQWYFSADSHKSVDMVLVLNGIPLFAFELKNQYTGQTVDDACKQWMYDRSPNEPCFRFNRRVLGFFCVDHLEARMTTRLAGKYTRFLPFNQGSAGAGQDGGAGNPPNAAGYPTAYLWEYVFCKESMMDIVQKFLNVEKGKKESEDVLVFPRFHQLDVVRKLLTHVQENGAGHNYLIQHSAGSGKSNSIAWTAYRLASLHNAENEPVFGSVVLVTDRTVLDRQLQNTIDGFDHTVGSVVTIGDNKKSTDLRDALNDGKRIIVTTLQKFPVIFTEVDQKHRNYAVIVDEAHSSQTGSSAMKLKSALVDMDAALVEYARMEGVEAETLDSENVLMREMIRQGKHNNLSFFAFTATPKDKTLELFGEEQPDNSFRPFHVYSMRQAIEEGFIHDVLQHYMTYKCCYRIAKQKPDSKEYPSSEATKLIRRFATLHPHNIAEKSRIIVETYNATTRAKIGGRGKMMVVTSSRAAAVLYFREMKRYIAEQGYADTAVMVAFSGSVVDGNEEVTEAKLNGFPDTQTKQEFHERGKILVVAEKYQTGFDEKLLHTMIVDKKLRSLKAVQTLSRVNRTTEGKVDTFILDFVNEKEEIQEAFQPYYQETLLDEELNIELIYAKQAEIATYSIYSSNDIEAFIREYTRKGAQDNQALGRMTSVLQPVVQRYNQKPQNERYLLRRLVRALVRWYGYAAQVTCLFDEDLHKEYVFCSYLSKLMGGDKVPPIDLDGLLKLEYYKLSKTFEGDIELMQEKGRFEHERGGSGTNGTNKKDLLDVIIERINERYKGDFTPQDRVILQDLHDKLLKDKSLAEAARTQGNPKVFEEGIFPQAFHNAAMESYTQSTSAYTGMFQDSVKYNAIMSALAEIMYAEFRKASIYSAPDTPAYPAESSLESSTPEAAE